MNELTQDMKAIALNIRLSNQSLTQIVWAALFLTLVMTIAGTGFGLASFILVEAGSFNLFSFFDFVPWTTMVFSFLGFLILKHHPKHTVGWLFLFVGFNSGFNTLFYSYMDFDQYVLIDNANTLLRNVTLLGDLIWWPVLILPSILAPLYFPDGRLLSPRWLIVAIAALLGMFCGMLTAFHSEPILVMDLGNPDLPNLKVSDRFLAGLAYVSVGLMLIGMVGNLASVIIRFRRSSGAERMQMKWLVYGAMISLILMIGLSIIVMFIPYGSSYDQINYFISEVVVMIIPAACGIAIIRHGLWDIDIVINRTLVYGGLTALIVALYILIVGAIGILFQTQTNTLSGLAAAGIIAVLFQPLRERLQGRVNRLLYGERDDPAAVLTRLAHHSETSETPWTRLP